MMKLASIKDNIICITASNQYDLASTFMRMQEFYESPKFRNKFIVLEDYMDWYAKEYDNFTYTSDWNGFNVPGNVVRKFFKVHTGELLKKEMKLCSILSPWVDGIEKFYVIGTWKNDSTVEHELSHAFYYLDEDYRKQMIGLLKNVPDPFKTHVKAELTAHGYNKAVFTDELIAYLASNTMTEMAEMFDTPIPWNDILPLQQALEKRLEVYYGEKES